jgi:UDP-N-acetylmuramate dehydrogenase
MGTALVSDKHANFIQADDAGRADDVLALMRHVRAEVERTSGFRLRSEIRLVGFDDEGF